MNATATVGSRVRFKNVLFATDFSPAAEHAIPFIRKIATHYRSNLVALYVRPPVINLFTVPGVSPTYAETVQAEDQQHRKEILQTFADIPTQVLIEEGEIRPCLEQMIQDKSIDLVVMGTRGRTGLGKLLMGSVAEEIFRTVNCPVLTVGPYSQPSRSPEGEFRAILCACDFTPASNDAAAYAVSLAQEFEARLSLLHVVSEPKPGDLVSWSDVRKSSEKLLRQVVPLEAERWCKPEYFVELGDPAERILDVAKVRDSDLIVLGAHVEEGVPGAAWHLGMATAHKVVSYARCPVLSVRR